MSMIGELRTVPAELMPALEDDDTCEEVAGQLMDGDGLSLDKLWNAMSFVLEQCCGSDPIEGDVLDAIDTGYGPPQLMSPADVSDAAARLARVTDDDVRKAFDPAAMKAARIYCEPGDDERERAQYLDELLRRVGEVKACFAEAAGRGDGMLYYLT